MVRFNCTAPLFLLASLSYFPVFAQVPIPSAGGAALNNIFGGGGGGGPAASFQFVRDITVVGNYAYATSGQGMVGVIDVSTPHSPITVGTISNNPLGAALSGAVGIAVQGNYAFVASSQSHALEIVDVSNPTSLVHTGKLLDGAGGAELSNARDLAVVGNNAFVVGNNTGGEVYLEVVNITNKSAPVHVVKVDIKHSSGFPAMFGQPLSITVVGNYAYVGSTSQLAVMDISTPSAPTFVTVLDNNDTNGPYLSFINNIAVKDNYLYLPAANQSGMEILDITNPAAPTHAAFFANGSGGEAIISQPGTVSVSGNYAYIVSESSYVEIADISNPLAPTHAATYTPAGGSTFSGAMASAVVGNICYLGTQQYFETIYIFDPAPPKNLNTNSVAQTSFNVIWNSSTAFSGYELDISADNFSTFLPGYNAKPLPAGTGQEEVTGLIASTAYNVRLRSLNANGESDNTSLTAYTLPAALTNVHVASTGSDGFTMSWDPVPDVQYFYQIGRSQDELDHKDPDFFTAVPSATLQGALYNIEPATQYFFGAYARNNGGFGPTTTIEVYTTPLAPTVTINNSDITQTSVKVGYIGIPGTTAMYLDIATDVNFTSMLSGYDNRLVTGNDHTTGAILQPNTTYHVRMRAANQGGSSVNSTTKTFVTLPAAMTALAPTLATSASFQANWTEVPGATKYWIDVSTTNDFVVKLTSYNNREVSAPNGGLVVTTGLDPGTTYYYRVRVTNATGDSPNSNVITAATLPDVPALNEPTNITLSTFDATWSAKTGATGYFLDVASDASFSNFVTDFINKSVGNVTTATVTGLTSSSTYYYRLRASNAGGTTASSAVKTVITAPPAPIATVATSVGQTGFTANWNSVSGVSDYRVDVSSDNTFASNVVINNSLASGVTSLAITGLGGGTTYYYRVRATNSTSTSANSNVITQLTIPPNPTTVAADPLQTSFTAKWNAATGATEYFVDVRDEAGVILAAYSNISVTTGTSLVVNNGIAAGTIYSYVVRAKNASGTSGNSAAQSVLTKPPTPTAIDAEVSGTISFTAKWNAAKSATSYSINVSTSPTFSSKVPGYDNANAGSGQSTTVTVNAPATGATYYYQVSATNASGTSDFSNSITVNTPVTTFPSINLPTGGTVEDYIIISIPAGVTPTTTLSKGAFGETWRIMHYDNATDKNVDVQDVTRETLKVGEGYWVNSNLDQAPTITMTGASLTTTQTITLLKGWNQIGNPFSFGISWADVKAKNPSISGVEDLYVYERGFSKKDALTGYGGGFVNNAGGGTVQLTIPTNVNRASRTTSRRHEIDGRDIASEEWFLPLTLESGGRPNDLGGLGMHSQAKDSHDRFDAIALPKLFNLASLSTNHPEFFQPRFMTDVVPTTAAYTWTFDVSADDDATLSWDNSAWGNASMFLIDDVAGAMIDMSKVDSYTMNVRGTRQIRFAFGKNGLFTPEVSGLGQPFPNPATDRVTFPFIGQPGQTISISVLDLTGRSVGSMTVENGRSGYNEAIWETSDTRVSPGVYLYQYTTSTGIRKTGRIVLK